MTNMETRYRIASRIMPGVRSARMLRGPVLPHWSDDGAWLWYETKEASGTNFILVEVASRRSSPLFDHVALASALAGRSGEPAVSTALPLRRVRFHASPRTVTFSAFNARWRWQDASATLEHLGKAFAAHELPSPDERVAAVLDGPNLSLRLADEEACLPLTRDGVPDFGYGDFIDFISQARREVWGPKLRPQALWSPDSTQLAVLRVDRRKVAFHHLVRNAPEHGVRPTLHSYRFPLVGDPLDEREKVEIWFISLDGRQVRARLEALESFSHLAFASGQARWSEDGRHLYVVDSDRFTRSVTLWRVRAEDGEVERLVQEYGAGVMRASPTLAQKPLFHPLPDGRLIWWSQRDGWGHLWMLGADGEARQLTRGEWQVRELVHVDLAAERITFTAGGIEPGVDPYFRRVCSVRFDGSELRLVSPERADHVLVPSPIGGNGEPRLVQAMSPSGQCFVESWSTVESPPVSVLRSIEGNVLTVIGVADPRDGRPAELPYPEPFSVRSIDGSIDLWGVLYKPVGFDPSASYPVVEVIYGAPQTAVVPKGWDPGTHGELAERLAAVGFVVFIIDGPGTPFRSHAFQLASHGRMEICGNLPDHIRALQTLASTRPWMDLDHVGIVGGSGGGFATVRAMATYPHFYKAGTAMCGSHDSTAYIPYWGEMFQGPWDAETYARQDNSRIAKDVRGPLFLVHGDMDDNCHPSMTLRLVDALIQADRDFELLIVPNGGHMLNTTQYVPRRIQDFFVRTLMKLEPPARTPALSVPE